MKIAPCLAAVFIPFAICPLHAGDPAPSRDTLIQYDAPAVPPRSMFARGRFEFSSVWQAYWSFDFGNDRPVLNYQLGGLRLGYMLTDPSGDGWRRHNYELLVEGQYAEVSHGPGDWIGGGNFILRRNFIGRDESLVWFAQLGAGLVANDVYKDRTQDLIGRSTEVSLLAGLGIRYQLSDDWSAELEVNYRHLSNAGTAERNTGLDSAGGGLSLTYSF